MHVNIIQLPKIFFSHLEVYECYQLSFLLDRLSICSEQKKLLFFNNQPKLNNSKKFTNYSLAKKSLILNRESKFFKAKYILVFNT